MLPAIQAARPAVEPQPHSASPAQAASLNKPTPPAKPPVPPTATTTEAPALSVTLLASLAVAARPPTASPVLVASSKMALLA